MRLSVEERLRSVEEKIVRGKLDALYALARSLVRAGERNGYVNFRTGENCLTIDDESATRLIRRARSILKEAV